MYVRSKQEQRCRAPRYIHTHDHTHTGSEQTSPGCIRAITCLFHLQLVLGLQLSLQPFRASSVSQDRGYAFSQKSCVVNSCGFFNVIFLLLLPLGKCEPSIKYLQHEQQIAASVTKTGSRPGTPPADGNNFPSAG